MTSSIRSTTSGSSVTQGASGALPASPSLDRDAFLKLLVAQLSHQDPLSPMEGTEFVNQLSQFASLEQAISQTSHLDVLSTQMRGLSNNEAVGLVGKAVTVRGHGISYDGVSATASSVSISAPAAQVTATLRDADGRVVRTLDLGARPGGPLSIQWDGRDANGQPVPRGSYQLSVAATTADGRSIDVTQDVTGTVTRVSFERGYPELFLDTGSAAPISDLVSVADRPRTP
jgi:flagellar basal-body rod modification protein FlgD